jgi:hypothetical protein
MNLELTPDTLVFFVDDTGHEALPSGLHVYGLGGCGLMAVELDPLVREPWREVRRQVLGSPDGPLHAADLRDPTQAQIDAITAFFTSRRIARIAARSRRFHRAYLSKALLNRIADVAKWTQFGQMAVIIESSERADLLLEAAFQDLHLEVDGTSVPAEIFFMPKSAHEPARWGAGAAEAWWRRWFSARLPRDLPVGRAKAAQPLRHRSGTEEHAPEAPAARA